MKNNLEDKYGLEIKSGDLVYNPADKDKYHSVLLIENKLK